MADGLIDLKIYSREGIVYEGEVESISSFNEDGEFDILSQHANFISLLEKDIKVKESNANVRKIDIDAALLRVKQNKVEIYMGVKAFDKPKNDGQQKKNENAS